MKTLKFKDFQISEHKADESGGMTIKGYGAVFGNVDSYGDVIEKGAFTVTLEQMKGRIAFCYQHDIWNPIGKIVSIKEDDHGLWIEVKLSEAESDIQTKVKEGILKEMSIGYRTVNSKAEVRDGEEINLLTEIKLYEVSLVTIAANSLAVVTEMKSEEKRDYLVKEFDRLIAITRNEKIKYELEKLKSIAVEVAPTEPPKQEEHVEPDEDITKSEVLEILKIK